MTKQVARVWVDVDLDERSPTGWGGVAYTATGLHALVVKPVEQEGVDWRQAFVTAFDAVCERCDPFAGPLFPSPVLSASSGRVTYDPDQLTFEDLLES